MKRRHLDFDIYLKEVLKNPKIKAEYDKLEPEFAVITAILEARVKKHMTQERLAKKIGTKQSAIARIESGNANPSIGFLQKLAEALGKKLVIRFE
ncbi:helix-turn-helix transcriptional regulator [Candidatus Woesebacteria bacterium]|nr:helix-turn-helix transcriptional regulator [Candidatus Woesebacteria bacterium]